MDGILNVYKPKGPTSHDVVDELRRILQVKKAGHAGTLDPAAEGVLAVCVGKATKLSSMLSDSGKTYRTVLLLGLITDTQDITGNILARGRADVGEDEVRAAIESFVGPYDQIPPMYSARKVHGKKLYELAREGKIVERQPKRVEITSIIIDDINLPRAVMTITCSKGTYIRTLCHDIGQKLGCGACMESLVRTRVGQFGIEDALSVSQIEDMYARGILDEVMLPPDAVFKDMPAVSPIAGTAADKFLHNGNPVHAKFMRACDEPECPTGNVRIYDSKGEFIGVYLYDAADGLYRPETLFL